MFASSKRALGRSWKLVASATVVIAVALAIPTGALANYYGPGYTGGTTTGSYYGPGTGYNTGYVQHAPIGYRGQVRITPKQTVYQGYAPAWRWVNNGWQRVYVPQGVGYTQPYSGQWRSVFTQYTGWVIMTDNAAYFTLS